MERSKEIFGNIIDEKTYKKALKSKKNIKGNMEMKVKPNIIYLLNH